MGHLCLALASITPYHGTSTRHPYLPLSFSLQLVQGLMQKLLLQLIAELHKLGGTVVHADCSSLILSTGKRNLTAAVG